MTVIRLLFVQAEEGLSASFFFGKKKIREQFQHCPPCCPGCMLSRRRQTAFVSSPHLLLAGPRARAVHSHFPSTGTLFGSKSVSLSVVGHSGTVRALDGRREVVGHGTGLRGGSERLGCGRTMDFVTLGVTLGRRAGVDAVRVALGSWLGRPPALPGGFDQILQGDGPSLHRGKKHN